MNIIVFLLVAVGGLTMTMALARGLVRPAGGRWWAVVVPILIGYGLLFATLPLPAVVTNLAVLAAGAAIATTLSLSMSTTGSVIAFAVAAAAVDLWSFTDGITRALLDRFGSGEASILRLLAITATIDGRTWAIAGIGDLAIGTAIFLGLTRAGFAAREVAAVLCASLAAAVAVGSLIGGAAGLPFFAVAALGYTLLRPRLGRDGSDQAPDR